MNTLNRFHTWVRMLPVLALLCLDSCEVYAAAIPGVVVTDTIVPTDTADTFPTHSAIYGKGGLRTVDSITARNAIPAERREEGMLVYVIESQTTYQLQADLVSWVEFTTGASGSTAVNTIADLLAVATGSLTDGHAVVVLGGTAIGDWGRERTAVWNSASTTTTNAISVFAGPSGGRWIFRDVDRGEVRPEWSVNWSSADARQAILDATTLAGTNGVVQFGAGVYNVSGNIILTPSISARVAWKGLGDIGARENGQFNDRTTLLLKSGSWTNFVHVQGALTFTFEGLTFNGNRDVQSTANPILEVSGTTSYYSGWINNCHFVYGSASGVLIRDRPQVYFINSSVGFCNGTALRGENVVDMIVDNSLFGKGLSHGMWMSNFTTLRVTRADIFENQGDGLTLIGDGGYSSGSSYFKQCVLNVHGGSLVRVKGAVKLIQWDNLLLDRANADQKPGIWTNAAASGTFSTITFETNSLGQRPREIRGNDMTIGFVEGASTKKPKYHLEDLTGADLSFLTLRGVSFVTPAGSPVNGVANVNLEGMDIDEYTMFSVSPTPKSTRSIDRLTVGTPTINTNFPFYLVGPVAIQETAVPANQWQITPDSTTGVLLISDSTDGDPFIALRKSGAFEAWSGGVVQTKTSTNGFEAYGSGVIQLRVQGAVVAVSNQLAVANSPAAGFAVTVKGPTVLQSTANPGTEQWALNPDQAANTLAIKDNQDADPVIYLVKDGSVLIDATQGVRIPERTQTQIDAIASPRNNALVINTTANELQRFKPGTGWVSVGAGGGGGTLNVNGGAVSSPNLKNNWAGQFAAAGSDITYAPRSPTSLSDAATIATDASLGQLFTVTIAGNRTLGVPTNPTSGQIVRWAITQDATGGRSLTADTGTGGFAGNQVITLPSGDLGIGTNANARSYVTAIYNSTANKWDVISVIPGL